MKRIFTGFSPIALLFTLIMGCMSAPPPPAASASGMDQLDPAIREASDYLNGRIPRGVKAVFLNIRSDYPDLSEYILSDLSTNAVNDGVFSVVDRAQLDALRAEMNFQLSGEVDDNSAQEIGKMLGAQTIVSGTVSKVGSLYRLEVKAIEVQTAGVQGQWRKNISSGEIIAALTENVVPASTGGAVTARNPAPAASPASNAAGGEPTAAAAGSGAQAPAEPQNPAAPAPVTYNIGDTGPAGGIIFYDKGNNSGGWRYLEAAPTDTGRTQWQSSATNISQTREDVGAGKENTQLAVRGSVRAAMLCDQYSLGGFDDWFLPSKGELDLMYINLKMIRNIGDFSAERYWSSTQSSSDFAWIQHFDNGNQGTDRKSNTFSVRAIRQF